MPGRWILTALLILVIATLIACNQGTSSSLSQLSGIIRIDGSSTVFPITEAVTEEFVKLHPRVRITVGISGTGGGFKKFIAGETDINDASRPITQIEMDAAAKNGIEFIELPVAYDGLSIVVHPSNDWVPCMTTQELKALWQPASEGKVTRWNQIRPEWPSQKIELVGPDTDSGTFDYFTLAIVGKEHSQRGDYMASADDNVLVEAIVGDKYALGYVGYAYYQENVSKLKLVAVDGGRGGGCVTPSPETIEKGTYQPLSRPLFVYVRKESAQRPEVSEFVNFYLTQGQNLVAETGYISLTSQAYKLALARFEKGVTGSLFAGGSQIGVTMEDLLKREQ